MRRYVVALPDEIAIAADVFATVERQMADDFLSARTIEGLRAYLEAHRAQEDGSLLQWSRGRADRLDVRPPYGNGAVANTSAGPS